MTPDELREMGNFLIAAADQAEANGETVVSLTSVMQSGDDAMNEKLTALIESKLAGE